MVNIHILLLGKNNSIIYRVTIKLINSPLKYTLIFTASYMAVGR